MFEHETEKGLVMKRHFSFLFSNLNVKSGLEALLFPNLFFKKYCTNPFLEKLVQLLERAIAIKRYNTALSTFISSPSSSFLIKCVFHQSCELISFTTCR